MNKQGKPLISVWVITYNHAGFIGKCLDSILSQVTEYPFEICLGEDESTDNTREICQLYAAKYPEVIRLFLRDRDDPRRAGCAGAWQFNFLKTFKACKGKYIAMCDGDDYWSDSRKLQTQVNWLEQHPGYSGCFHKIGQVDENNKIICQDVGYPLKRREFYSLDYLLRFSNFSPMLSVVFRNHSGVAPDWIKQAPFGDMIIHAGNLRCGNYGFIDEVMGFYRIHSGGLASDKSRLHNVRATIEVYRLIGENFNLENHPAFRQGILALRLSYYAECLFRYIVPKALKRKFDLGFGRKCRSLVRRIIALGH